MNDVELLYFTGQNESLPLTRDEVIIKGLQADQDIIEARFEIKTVPGKGRGVYLNIPIIKKDEYVCEYSGDFITAKEAAEREKMYTSNQEGCFIMNVIVDVSFLK